MTTQEFKKKIYDTVEPLLDGQGQVRFKVYEYAKSNLLSIEWRDTSDDLIAFAQISETPSLVTIAYQISCICLSHYETRLNAIAQTYAVNFDELNDYRLFEDWTGVEKTLQTFTEYLVREFN